ncbi:phospholipase B1, membrane-associated-like [Bombus terrestris]|uniref:Phospholipase B1, membrane-associated-like n=1 Tax=Bombus terrestris TaxID=30195 RepID=A0A9C6SII7_BOMTE|nr:phospholipase B1, membrane-associated-like [Bombus terrestris]
MGGGGGILWVWRLFTVSVVFMESSVVSSIQNLLGVVTWLAVHMYSNVFTLICLAGRSSKDPESVHHLKPGDIDVIAAMGDSLTIGAGVTSIYTFEVHIENRGIVGSIGGQGTWRQYLTLPNILKEFNPKLVGYSLGDALSTDPAAQLNVAEGGAMSRDITFMATYLVNKIKEDPRIDIKKHCKVRIFVDKNINSHKI